MKIGNPLDPSTLCGPLHSKKAVEVFKNTVCEAEKQGGRVLYGGTVLESEGNYVMPTIISLPGNNSDNVSSNNNNDNGIDSNKNN